MSEAEISQLEKDSTVEIHYIEDIDPQASKEQFKVVTTLVLSVLFVFTRFECSFRVRVRPMKKMTILSPTVLAVVKVFSVDKAKKLRCTSVPYYCRYTLK